LVDLGLVAQGLVAASIVTAVAQAIWEFRIRREVSSLDRAIILLHVSPYEIRKTLQGVAEEKKKDLVFFELNNRIQLDLERIAKQYEFEESEEESVARRFNIRFKVGRIGSHNRRIEVVVKNFDPDLKYGLNRLWSLRDSVVNGTSTKAELSKGVELAGALAIRLKQLGSGFAMNRR